MNKRALVNRLMNWFSLACAFLAVVLLALVLGSVAIKGLSSLDISPLNISSPSPPLYERFNETSVVSRALFGTLRLLCVACLIGLPCGLSTGIYLAEYGTGTLCKSVRFLFNAFDGVPSIIIGTSVYALIFSLRQSFDVPQFSTLAGGFALALIIIPSVARTTEFALQNVPHDLREAALALGATSARASYGVILPAAAARIAAFALLAAARAGGEAAPLLLTVFALDNFSRNFTDNANRNLAEPAIVLPIQIYKFAISPNREQQAQAWAASLILVLLILGINLVVKLTTRKTEKQ